MQENLNRTIVRIWSSRANPKYHGKGVGHISIELERANDCPVPFYISLWPYGITAHGCIANSIPQKLHTFQDDMDIEGREPEIMICFYSLDNDRIFYRFESAAQRLQGWSVFGNLLQLQEDKKESCASLAYKLLKFGDVSSIMPTLVEECSTSFKESLWFFRSPSYCSEICVATLVKSPDSLIEGLTRAKLKECQQRPDLQVALVPNETDLATIVPASSMCSVM
jgi:hypothetical protein